MSGSPKKLRKLKWFRSVTLFSTLSNLSNMYKDIMLIFVIKNIVDELKG